MSYQKEIRLEKNDRSTDLISEEGKEEGKATNEQERKKKTKQNAQQEDLENDKENVIKNLMQQLEPKIKTTRKRSKRSNKKKYNINVQPNIVNTQRYQQARKTNKEVVKKKVRNVAKTKGNMLEWWGDKIHLSETWPSTEERSWIRLFHINTHGVCQFNDLVEWEMIIGFLMELQVDIFGLTEINLDLNKPKVVDSLQQKTQRYDQYLKLACSASKLNLDSDFKMGGTITGVNGVWSGRLEAQGSEPMGRWSYITLTGKQGRKFTVITTYRVCKATTKGECTIRAQQQQDILIEKKKLQDPRAALLTDLLEFIQKKRNEGNLIALMGDMNTDIEKGKDAEMERFMKESGLVNTMAKAHKNKKLPPTFDRGTRCIDLLGISEEIDERAIIRAGYLPFYYYFATDHRGGYVDINIDAVFGNIKPDTTRNIYRRFTTRNISKCNKYLQKLEQNFEICRIFQSVDKLEVQCFEHMNDHTIHNIEKIKDQCRKLHNKVTELMKNAEKAAGPIPYKDGYPHSIQLKKAAMALIRAKKYARLVSIGVLQTEEIEKQIAQEEVKKAQKELKKCHVNGKLLREEYLTQLGEKRAQQWNMDASDAIQILNETEKIQKMHNKQRRFLKPKNTGTIRKLLVPSPIEGIPEDIYDDAFYTEVNTSEEMFNVLLRQNFRHLMKSKDSMFSKGSVLDKIGWYAEKDGAQSILEGTCNAKALTTEYPEFGNEAEEFINAIKYSEVNGKSNSFEWKYGPDEYIATFNKTREATACGPSGLHMSHWKAACERKRIARVHAFFIWAGFQLGITYPRWEQSWHCMLQKTNKPIVTKLRIIQLFEGDFNAALKYLLGKKLMKYMHENDIHDSETFGSRIGKTAPEAVQNIRLLCDHSRIWKKTTAIFFNDAEGCYDRIPPNLCSLTMQSKGCPESIARCHTLVQKSMRHSIRIATGISKGIIQFATTQKTVVEDGIITLMEGPTGGIGQGGGGGPIAWITVIIIMLMTYRRLNEGAKLNDCLGWYALTLWVISYVDDNTIVRIFPQEMTPEMIFAQLTQHLESWRKILQITGGDLDITKSNCSVMKWKWKGMYGNPTIMNKKELPGTITVTSTLIHNGNPDSFKRLEPWEATRVLGVRIPMTGSMKPEKEYRKKQAKDFGEKLARAPLSHHESYIAYETRYKPMIRYPLQVTTFTDKECNEIQKSFMHKLLPKIGLNRNTPRSIIYGPRSLGGRGLMDLRTEQATIQWKNTIGHMRRMDAVGKALHITLHDHQIEIGSASSFLNINPTEYNYGTKDTKWEYMWKSAYNTELQLEIFGMWVPRLKNEGDLNLMDTAVKDTILVKEKWKLYHVNHCRMYMQAFNLSDLTNHEGKLINGFLNGTLQRRHEWINFPNIRPPTTAQWAVWKSFISRNFLRQGYTIYPPITTPIVREIKLYKAQPEEEQIKNMYAIEGTVIEIIEQMPKQLRVLIGTIKIPRDKGVMIKEALIKGECKGASDGSLINTFNERWGGHGYIIQTSKDSIERYEGYATTPTSDAMTSQTTEHYGLLGIVLLLHCISIAHNIRKKDEAKIQIYIDNKEVSERGNRKYNPQNVSEYLQPDSDLWALTTNLITILPIEIKVEWIRSHQDSTNYGIKTYGPYPLPAQMNIDSDILAAKGLNKNNKVRRATYSTSALNLYTKEGLQIEKFHHHRTIKKNGVIMKQYYKDRRGWDAIILGKIDWEGLDATLKTYGPITCNHIMQLMHNWQNVGWQQAQFREASGAQPGTTMEEEVLCPMGCKEVEVPLHYLYCQEDIMIKERYVHRKEGMKIMQSLQTEDIIISIFALAMENIGHEDDIDMDASIFRGPILETIGKAFDDQEEIGWKALFQGYLATKWSEAQEMSYKKNGLYTRQLTGKIWGKKIVTMLQTYTYQCWKSRNHIKHGTEKEESIKEERKGLKKKIRDLYKQRKEIRNEKEQQHFYMPVHKRTNQGTHSMKIWISTAEEIVRMNREKATQNTIDRWLRHRPG